MNYIFIFRKQCKTLHIKVKLLLSLDRGRSLEDAKNTLNLAKYYAVHVRYIIFNMKYVKLH